MRAPGDTGRVSSGDSVIEPGHRLVPRRGKRRDRGLMFKGASTREPERQRLAAVDDLLERVARASALLAEQPVDVRAGRLECGAGHTHRGKRVGVVVGRVAGEQAWQVPLE